MKKRALNGLNVPAEFFDTGQREPVSTYSELAGAHHAVDVLAENGFEIRSLAIVGRGLSTVERIGGRLGYGRVALSGAFSGLYFGAGICLVAMLAGFLQPGNGMNTLVACMVIGVGVGVLLAVLNFSLNRNRASFTSLKGFTAARYELLAPRGEVSKARQILAQHAVDEH